MPARGAGHVDQRRGHADGAALVFVTTGDVAAVRTRADAFAAVHTSARRTGTRSARWSRRRSTASVSEIDGGASSCSPADPDGAGAVQRRAAHARRPSHRGQLRDGACDARLAADLRRLGAVVVGVAREPPPVAPAHPASPTRRPAGSPVRPASLRPGVVSYPDVPRDARRTAPPPSSPPRDREPHLASRCCSRSRLRAVAAASCARPVDVDVEQRLGAPIDRRRRRRRCSRKPDRSRGRGRDRARQQPAARRRARRARHRRRRRSRRRSASVRRGRRRSYRFGTRHELRGRCACRTCSASSPLPRRRAAAHAELAAPRRPRPPRPRSGSPRASTSHSRDLLAAQQEIELRRTAFDAADAAATLRERMHAAGNTTDLAQARDRDAREQARIELGRAEAERRAPPRDAQRAARPDRRADRVDRDRDACAELPGRAPALDTSRPPRCAASLDLAAGRARVDAAANRAGDRAAARVAARARRRRVGDRRRGRPRRSGPRSGSASRCSTQRAGERARASRRARTRASTSSTATAVELRAPARAARITALATYDEARHLHDVVLPLRQQIVDETLLHYNAMDADPFQLIARAPRARRRRPPVPRRPSPLRERDGERHRARSVAWPSTPGAPMSITRRNVLSSSLLAGAALVTPQGQGAARTGRRRTPPPGSRRDRAAG